MNITFRSKLFDVSGHEGDDDFCGEDLANWLAEHLSGWSTFVLDEDWGWAVAADRADERYLFGVYDHDTNDEDESGALWVIRIYNEQKSPGWMKQFFLRKSRPEADPSVVEEVVGILKAAQGITEILVTPID